MRLSVKTAAMAILVSLGVTACSSGGGGGGSSAPANNPEQAKQIEALKKQVEAEQQAVKSAQNNANQASEKVKASETAKAKAEAELAKAQQALKNVENATAAEKAKAQAAAEQAAKDLAAANKAVEAAKAATVAEQAKAQAAADKAAKDLAEAQSKIELLENELAPYRQEEERKRQEQEELARQQEELERIKKEAYTSDDSTWRYIKTDNKADGALQDTNPKMVTSSIPQLHYQSLPTDNSVYRVLETSKLDLSKFDKSDAIHIIPVTAVEKTILYKQGKETTETKNLGNVGSVYFTNQNYSTYMNFAQPEVLVDNNKYVQPFYGEGQSEHIRVYNSPTYVALATPKDADSITSGVVATYKGKAIETVVNQDFKPNGDHYPENAYGTQTLTTKVSGGNFELTADFKNGLVSGKISNLLSGNSDYQLNEGKIKQENFYDNSLGIVEMVTFEGKANNGSFDKDYKGIFAGPNAEEVVGTVGNDISFGGKRQ